MTVQGPSYRLWRISLSRARMSLDLRRYLRILRLGLREQYPVDDKAFVSPLMALRERLEALCGPSRVIDPDMVPSAAQKFNRRGAKQLLYRKAVNVFKQLQLEHRKCLDSKTNPSLDEIKLAGEFADCLNITGAESLAPIVNQFVLRSSRICDSLLTMYITADQHDKVDEIVETCRNAGIPMRDPKRWNKVVKYKLKADVAGGLQILSQLQEQGFAITNRTYFDLLSILLDRGEISNIIAFLNRVQNSKFVDSLTPYITTRVVSVLLDHAHVKQSLQLLLTCTWIEQPEFMSNAIDLFVAISTHPVMKSIADMDETIKIMSKFMSEWNSTSCQPYLFLLQQLIYSNCDDAILTCWVKQLLSILILSPSDLKKLFFMLMVNQKTDPLFLMQDTLLEVRSWSSDNAHEECLYFLQNYLHQCIKYPQANANKDQCSSIVEKYNQGRMLSVDEYETLISAFLSRKAQNAAFDVWNASKSTSSKISPHIQNSLASALLLENDLESVLVIGKSCGFLFSDQILELLIQCLIQNSSGDLESELRTLVELSGYRSPCILSELFLKAKLSNGADLNSLSTQFLHVSLGKNSESSSTTLLNAIGKAIMRSLLKEGSDELAFSLLKMQNTSCSGVDSFQMFSEAFENHCTSNVDLEHLFYFLKTLSSFGLHLNSNAMHAFAESLVKLDTKSFAHALQVLCTSTHTSFHAPILKVLAEHLVVDDRMELLEEFIAVLIENLTHPLLMICHIFYLSKEYGTLFKIGNRLLNHFASSPSYQFSNSMLIQCIPDVVAETFDFRGLSSAVKLITFLDEHGFLQSPSDSNAILADCLLNISCENVLNLRQSIRKHNEKLSSLEKQLWRSISKGYVNSLFEALDTDTVKEETVEVLFRASLLLGPTLDDEKFELVMKKFKESSLKVDNFVLQRAVSEWSYARFARLLECMDNVDSISYIMDNVKAHSPIASQLISICLDSTNNPTWRSIEGIIDWKLSSGQTLTDSDIDDIFRLIDSSSVSETTIREFFNKFIEKETQRQLFESVLEHLAQHPKYHDLALILFKDLGSKINISCPQVKNSLRKIFEERGMNFPLLYLNDSDSEAHSRRTTARKAPILRNKF